MTEEPGGNHAAEVVAEIWEALEEDEDSALVGIIDRALRDMRDATIDACIETVTSEPEYEGPCPPELKVQLEALGVEESHRFACKTTKRCIVERIRAMKGNVVNEKAE